MMKKNTRKILYFFLLLIIFVIIFFIFKNEMEKERLEYTNIGLVSEETVLPLPDKIIYKDKNDITETNHNTIISNNMTTNNNIITNINNNNINRDKYALDYCIENSKCYAIKDNKKIEIISVEKACDIADIEAQNKKYQYQPWESEFYTRGKNKNESMSAELIYDLSDISKWYHWNENWKKSEYKNIIMWKVRLFDENDPLTSLYIYINAVNGEVVGAGSMSD